MQQSALAMPVFLLLPFSLRTAAQVISLRQRFCPVTSLLQVVVMLPDAQYKFHNLLLLYLHALLQPPAPLLSKPLVLAE